MLCLCEVNRFLSKFFARSCSGCQVIGLGRETIFMGLSDRYSNFPFMCLPLSHPFFLEPKYFPALATQANTKQGYPIVSVINIHAQSMCCAQDGLNILGALISFPPSIVSASTRKTVWMIILHSLSQGLKTFYTE